MRYLLLSLLVLALPFTTATAQSTTQDDRMFIHCSVAQIDQLHFRDADWLGLHFPNGIGGDAIENLETFDAHGILQGASLDTINVSPDAVSITSMRSEPRMILILQTSGERDETGSILASIGRFDDPPEDDLRFARCLVLAGSQVDQAFEMYRSRNSEIEAAR